MSIWGFVNVLSHNKVRQRLLKLKLRSRIPTPNDVNSIQFEAALKQNTIKLGARVKIRKLLGSKKWHSQNNPHKRAPDVYFKPIWFSKSLYEGIQYISKLEKKSIRKTADELMMQTIRDYVVKLVHTEARYQVELNELYRRGIDEKNVRLWMTLFRKILADREASGT